MPLPPIDFQAIATTAKQALVAYGSPAEFIEQGASSGRMVRFVPYKDTNAERLMQEMNSVGATVLLNPDDFAAPHRLPQEFDTLRISVGGFQRTYTVDSVHPIYAESTLPLLLAQLRAN